MVVPLNIFKKSEFYFILLFIIALPFSITVSNYLLGAVIFVALFKEGKKSIHDYWSKELTALSFFIGLYLVNIFSLLYTIDFTDVFDLLVLKLPILIVPIIFYFKISLSQKQIRLIFLVYIATVTVAVIFCLFFALHKLYIFNQNISQIFEYKYAYQNFSKVLNFHPTYFSIFILFSIVLLFNELRGNKKSKSRKVLLILLILLLTLAIIILMSRIVIISYILLMIFIFPYFFLRGHRVLYSQVLLIIFISMAMFIIYEEIPYFRERFKNDVLLDLGLDDQRNLDKGGEEGSSRILRWGCALKLIMEHPLLGYGVGDGQNMLQDCYKEEGLTVAYTLNYNTHNQFLDMWLRNGAIGMVILVGCFFYPFRSKNILYISFGIIILMACLTENILDRQKGVMFYSVFNTLMLIHLKFNNWTKN